MGTRNYYFVAPSLPSLTLGEIPDIDFERVFFLLEPNLSQEDWRKVVIFRRLIDLYNIRALYEKKPIDSRGNLSEKELDEALLVKADLPDYVFDFLDQFQENKEKVNHFFGLLSQYFEKEKQEQKGFFRKLLEFQKELRLVLTALRAKKMKRDLVKELQFEDFTDPYVAQILSQKDMEDYEPPLEYQDLKQLLLACGDDPMKQHQTILEYEFQKIEEMTAYPLFSSDWILGYVARLLIVERYNSLDAEKGAEVIQKMKVGT